MVHKARGADITNTEFISHFYTAIQVKAVVILWGLFTTKTLLAKTIAFRSLNPGLYIILLLVYVNSSKFRKWFQICHWKSILWYYGYAFITIIYSIGKDQKIYKSIKYANLLIIIQPFSPFLGITYLSIRTKSDL